MRSSPFVPVALALAAAAALPAVQADPVGDVLSIVFTNDMPGTHRCDYTSTVGSGSVCRLTFMKTIGGVNIQLTEALDSAAFAGTVVTKVSDSDGVVVEHSCTNYGMSWNLDRQIETTHACTLYNKGFARFGQITLESRVTRGVCPYTECAWGAGIS